MDQFKVDHFADENEGRSFPYYESLSEVECEGVRVRFCQQLGLPRDCAGVSLVSRLAELQTPVERGNAEDEGFDFKAQVMSIGIETHGDMFLNWYQFDNIDKLSLDDLAHHFHDIWYPASDDIDICLLYTSDAADE